MDFAEIARLTDETQQIQEIYKVFTEESRLNHSQAARVEFLTTMQYIERYLKKGDRILDIGAGAGEYSLTLARKGYAITALELTDANITAFQQKMNSEDSVELFRGDARDLSRFQNNSFDLVLLLGPLYHLHSREDRLRCIHEAKRVCKADGTLYFAFISNDFIPLTELSYREDYFKNGDYDKETFKMNDFPFVFHTLDAARKLLHDGGIRLLHEVAADGVSELLADKINAMDAENYAQYLRYHTYICEKPEFLGMTNHLLFVGKKI